MPADLDALLARGGKGRIDLLQFAVCSVQPEPLFVLLVGELQLAPTVERAVVLDDVFCAAGAAFRLRCPELLAPIDLRLITSLRPLRQYLQHLASPPLDDDGKPLPARRPSVAGGLFDHLVDHVRRSDHWRAIADHYDPSRGPHENLPDGKMTAAQRHFVDRVWQPAVRPRLVSAGFRHAATLGS
jgi:hypothetical protein